MQITARILSRNTSVLTASLLIQKILAFIYFSYLATQLGVSQTGLYFFSLSVVALFSVFIDFGIINTIIKEIVKYPEKINTYFSNTIVLRLIFGLVIYSILIGIVFFTTMNSLTKTALLIAGIIMLIDSFTLLFYGFLRSYHNTIYEAFGNILFQIILLIFGIGILMTKPEVLLVLAALLIASFSNLVYSLTRVVKLIKPQFTWQIDWLFVKKLLIIALPFALAGIFARGYGYLDTLLLNILGDQMAVGYYSLPYKITFVWQFIPLAFIASVYPAFSAFFKTDKVSLSKLFHKVVIYLLMISLPIAIGLSLMAKSIFINIYGLDYLPSAYALQVLILCLPLLFINFPVGYLLNACNRQVQNTINIFIAMIVSLICNVILIPLYSFIGAAYVSVVTTTLLFVLGFYYVLKIIQIDWAWFLKKMLKLILCVALMAAFILLIGNQVNYLFVILFAAIIYLISIFVFQLITWGEIKYLYQSIIPNK
ncbi:MAG: flippase [Candidatus Komeilibacteria bacterium]